MKNPRPDLETEISLGFLLPKECGNPRLIIGVDEVGRGCLAGPVVAAAALLPSDCLDTLWFDVTGKRKKGRVPSMHPHRALLDVTDSKLIPENERHSVRDAVASYVRGYAIGEASVAEIERLNILYASHLAMERAVASLEEKLGQRADLVLVDGHIVPKAFKSRGAALIKGDLKSFSIACASIIAKVYRDDLMKDLEQQYPGYGLSQHKGYSTPFHKSKIKELGVTPIHRAEFKGVKEYLEIAPQQNEMRFE